MTRIIGWSRCLLCSGTWDILETELQEAYKDLCPSCRADKTRPARNRELGRQHSHTLTPEEIEGMQIRPGRLAMIVSVLGRLGYVARRDIVAYHKHGPFTEDAAAFLASLHWYDMTPEERRVIYPWSACLAYQANPTRKRKDPALRYPRILAAMRWLAVLSWGEAQSGMLAYKAGRTFDCEAINHYGGPAELVRRAVDWLRRSTPGMRAHCLNYPDFASKTTS